MREEGRLEPPARDSKTCFLLVFEAHGIQVIFAKGGWIRGKSRFFSSSTGNVKGN